ncbi:MAG: prepilin-type N-terminal cleavage/methylation domain-containing protein [Proteobacteria bacterium]|nr:prepilin-type N-terminal cleavage/methylation domain-containing protein [Pseudomonadota bacterium]
MEISNNIITVESRKRRGPSPGSCLLTSDFRSSKKGFTLIELIMTIIILGFASLIMIPFVSSIASSPDPVVRQRAISLGQALMDEILAKKWDENTPMGGGPIGPTSESARGTAVPASAIGPDGAETRVDYDDVDDYDGLAATGNFVDQNNSPFTLAGYSRSAAIRYIASTTSTITAANPVGTSAGGASATDTKRIVVTVTSPRGETFELVALKCNY